MPSWDDDDKLTTDPNNEVSLIYYPNKQGLEDRVFRIETERSSASTPDTRTGHAITNIEVLSQDEKTLPAALQLDDAQLPLQHRRRLLRHLASTRSTPSGPKPLIKRKYVVLKNDYIHHLLDIYHI